MSIYANNGISYASNGTSYANSGISYAQKSFISLGEDTMDEDDDGKKIKVFVAAFKNFINIFTSVIS
jgi:hypothetical protein